MALTAEQLKARDGKLTASRVGVLMGGDPQAIHDLWREMIGDPSYAPDDLSGVWPVQLGSFTEPLHLDWYERQTGTHALRRGEVVIHPEFPWAACTLDGWSDTWACPIECKHCGNFRKLEDVISTYQAQLHWQMIVTGAKQAILSVIIGALEPVQEIISYDVSYGDQLWQRAAQFMACVESLTPPVALPAVAAPVAPEQFINVDMSGNNAWASNAADWLINRDPAKKHEAASKELKALVEANVGLAFGHGIQIKRSKSNSLTIKEARS